MHPIVVDIKKKNFTSNSSDHIFTAIENLKFELLENEFTCIIGPSGCGKTTLLNAIAGLDNDYDGSINIKKTNPSELHSSYVFQTPRLLPWRTVMENIQLAAGDNHSVPFIINTLQHLGLGNNLNSYPHHLSLGMQRRVAIARAFSVQSRLLLMDEPFVSLDPSTAKKARELLLNLWREQPRNILFVTHDLNEAFELADRILFLSDSPSHVIADVQITSPRPERTPQFLDNFKNQLSTKQPHLHQFL